jgi:alanine dehydrogenase
VTPPSPSGNAGGAGRLVIGVPREIKADEHRVAITPDGVREVGQYGVSVLVEAGAGRDSSFPDEDYLRAGAEIVDDAAEVWQRAGLICKVKEPQTSEFAHFRDDLTIFTYLHLAAYPGVADALLEHGTTGIAYETVTAADGALPLLAPMSEVAGRMSIQIGAHYLERHNGGRGVLLGGAPGVRPARVVVLGAGNVGWNAAWMAAGLEAEIDLLDRNVDRLRFIDQIQMGRITTLTSNRGQVERVVAEADLVIGAVLVAGGRAPVVVTEDMIRTMKRGAVVVDIAIDQGGCIETSHETSHADPVFTTHGVVHYAVGNMPGAVPFTSTYALTNVTLPYLAELARLGVAEAARRDAALALGFNTVGGHVTNPAVAEALGRPYVPLEEAHA